MFMDDTDSTARRVFPANADRFEGRRGRSSIPWTIRPTVATEHDTGWKLGGNLGRNLGSGLRIEGEVFIANAEVSKLTHGNIAVPALWFTLPG